MTMSKRGRMNHYIVEYRPSPVSTKDNSEFFRCQADDIAHAIEQMLDAYPNMYACEVYLRIELGDLV